MSVLIGDISVLHYTHHIANLIQLHNNITLQIETYIERPEYESTLKRLTLQRSKIATEIHYYEQALLQHNIANENKF